MKTNKIRLVGEIDGQPFNQDFEFANLDKAGVISQLRNASDCGYVDFSDIHGRCFSMNHSRVKYFYLNVIEIID